MTMLGFEDSEDISRVRHRALKLASYGRIGQQQLFAILILVDWLDAVTSVPRDNDEVPNLLLEKLPSVKTLVQEQVKEPV